MSFIFKKFNSIENAYRKAFIEKITLCGLDKGDFIVQEKVHGANFSFWFDGETIQCGKRTAMLLPEDNFYNFQAIQERYTLAIRELYKDLKSRYSETTLMTVYGELMGGNRHPAIERLKDAIMVQKGIFYTNQNEFYAFDIRINNETYLSVEEANSLFEKHGFFYAKTLLKGTLAEALEYPNEFNSKISEWLGFPSIESNICEGTIIRPNEPQFFPNGVRVLIKNKNERWSERKQKRKNSAQVDNTLSAEATGLKSILETYITENRLLNVISKIGTIDFKDFGKVMGLMNQDILEDFNKDYAEAFSQLEKKEQKRLRKSMTQPVRRLILNYLKQ